MRRDMDSVFARSSVEHHGIRMAYVEEVEWPVEYW
jgi:hypothetical protein